MLGVHDQRRGAAREPPAVKGGTFYQVLATSNKATHIFGGQIFLRPQLNIKHYFSLPALRLQISVFHKVL